MDELISTLNQLASKSNLVPAELILTTHLIDFEELMPKTIDEKLFDEIELSLLNLLNINKGTLSFPASIRIANCLLTLYKTTSPPKLWNLFSRVSDQPNPSNVIAIGHIINKIGSSSKSIISGLTAKLVAMTGNLLFPAIYALKQCFKRDRIDLDKFSKKAFSIAKKGISTNNHEHTVLASIGLFCTLVKQNTIAPKKFLSIANDILKSSSSSAFIIDMTCYFIAKIAYHSLMVLESEKDKNEDSDFVICASTKQQVDKYNAQELFQNAFSIMTYFKQHFSAILCHFLNLLDPKVICKYLSLLFTTIRRINPREIRHLISLFGPDTRKELFQLVSNENPPSTSQLDLLITLQGNKSSIHELSALAMQLTSSNNMEDKMHGKIFFESLAKSQPDHAQRYLETAMLYLGYPPDSNPNLENEVEGFAMIASAILDSINDRNGSANKVAKNITAFTERALTSKHFLKAEYRGVFNLMASLPDYLIPKSLVTESLQSFTHSSLITSSNTSEEIGDDKLKLLTYYITLFFSKHEQHELASSFFSFVMDHPNLQSKQAMISICHSAPHIMKGSSKLMGIAKSILPHILKCQPHQDFINNHIKEPMIPINTMIGGSIGPNVRKPIRNDSPSKISSIFPYEMLNLFADLVNALPENSIRNFIQSFASIAVNSTTSSLLPSFSASEVQMAGKSAMFYSLLLALCSNTATVKYLDDESLFPAIFMIALKEEKMIIKMQIIAECLGKWANEHNGYLSCILSQADSTLDIPQRCFVYAAILSNVSIDNDVIMHIMNELDNIALMTFSDSSTASSSYTSLVTTSNYSIYALHGLSVLLHSYADQLAEMNVADIQFRIILTLLNSEKAIEPYSLEYIASCFTKLLPVLTISTQHSSLIDLTDSYLLNLEKTTVNHIRLAIQAFQQIKVPYAKQVMFMALRSAFVFVKDIASDQEMVFPTSKGSSLILQTLACGAFSDMLKVGVSHVDYFDLIPRVLILLQRSQSTLASDFIVAVADSFAFSCLNQYFDHSINEHLKLIQDKQEVSDDNETNQINEENAKKLINSEKNIKRINDWVLIIKTIIASNSLPLTGKYTIESNDCVKQCALSAANYLIPLIARSEPLLNECLDDLMTSITRAIETRNISLINEAYNLLLSILNNFEKVLQNGQRILELYDSQFSIAIRNGFQAGLTFSAPVLIKYIDFQLSSISKSQDEFKLLFSLYISGLTSIKKTDSIYYTIATHICHIVETHDYLFDLMDDYKNLLIVQLCEVISISMALWRSVPADWEQISSFRKNFSSSYSDIVTSFIWLQSKSAEKELIPVSQLFDFFVEEVSEGSEYWRMSAAFSALIAILTFTPDVTTKISTEKINQVIKGADHAKQIMPRISTDYLPKFMKAVATMNSKSTSSTSEKNTVNWKQLFSFLISNEFDLESFANLIKDGSSFDLESEFNSIITTMVKNYKVSINNEQCIALFTLLMEKSMKLIEMILSFLSENAESKVFASLKFRLYFRLLRRVKAPSSNNENEEYKKLLQLIDNYLPSISLFAWTNFKQGGMDLIAQVMIENPNVGVRMFVYDNLKTLSELALTDFINCEVYIQFCTFGYQVYHVIITNPNPDFDISVSKFAFAMIIKWSENVQKGSGIVQSAVILINTLLKHAGKAVRAAFSSLGVAEQRIVNNYIESQIIQLENKKKVQNLMVFSNSTKRNRVDLDEDGEWQNLDVDNDEDSF